MAIQHLVAGSATGADVDERVEAFGKRFQAALTLGTRLWWVCQAGEPRAVAMVFLSKGHVGFLYHSPAGAPGVDGQTLVELIRASARDALRRGAAMVQSMVAPSFEADADVLTRAGLTELAELIYLRSDLASLPAPAETPWEFLDFRRFRRKSFLDVIQRTYQATFDCPRLAGVRTMKDVLVSHKTTGVYTPRWWWLARRDRQPAGCLLANRTHEPSTAETVYMGVTPEVRGQGLGGALLAWSAHRMRRDGMRWLRLAVDANNEYARRLYSRFGFVEMGRKRCFVLLSIP